MLHEQTMKRVKAEYALKGRIRLVHHDFPLPMHKHARRAAALAAAADRFGKFDAVADALFLQQDTWSKTGSVDDVVDSVLTPEERKKIDQIAAEPEIAAALERDVQLGTRSKVSSTPTMIITHNGQPQPGSRCCQLSRVEQVPGLAAGSREVADRRSLEGASTSFAHRAPHAAGRRVHLRRLHQAAAVVAALRAVDRLLPDAARVGCLRSGSDASLVRACARDPAGGRRMAAHDIDSSRLPSSVSSLL